MKKDPTVFLKHITECIELIESYTRNLSKDDFLARVEIQDAVVGRLEIIGEAAKNIPDETQNLYPGVAWKQIVTARNILIHEYFGVDLDLVWDIVKNDPPILKAQIKRMLE